MPKIFVLEDDRDIREVIEWILEGEHYEVVSFKSVKDFMNRNQEVPPSLFLLDIMLPDGSGIEVCNALRQDRLFHDIPIVLMSAHASSEQVRMGCAANAFIQKPFEIDVFLGILRTQIHLNGS